MTTEEVQSLVNKSKIEIDGILAKLATDTGGFVVATTSGDRGPDGMPEILVSVSVFSRAITDK